MSHTKWPRKPNPSRPPKDDPVAMGLTEFSFFPIREEKGHWWVHSARGRGKQTGATQGTESDTGQNLIPAIH